MTDVETLPLQEGLSFGARIRGLTPRNIGIASVRLQIQAVFEQQGMIVFEEVEPSSEMQVMISEIFGPLKEHPVKSVERLDDKKLPGVITIRTDPGACIVEIDGKRLMTWQPWHFDHSYNDELNRGGVLRAETIAPEDGRTGFADGVQIYNALRPEVRAKLDRLNVLYTLDLRYSQQKFGLPENFREIAPKPAAQAELARTMPLAIHPAVWTRASGEKVVHMSPYGARGVEGMQTNEAYDLLSGLWDEIEEAIQPYFHSWKLTDMLVWDNWRMLHQATGVDPKYDRVMHRTTIKGDYGLGRWDTKPQVIAA